MRWTFSLATDVSVAAQGGEVRLETAAGVMRLRGAAARGASALACANGALAGMDEAGVAAAIGPAEDIVAARAQTARLLGVLHREGLLARTLSEAERPIATLEPRRAPDDPRADHPLADARRREDPPADSRLRLSPLAMARAVDGRMIIAAPGSWACAVVHEPALLALLDALARGCAVADCARALPSLDAATVAGALGLMRSCALFEDPRRDAWPAHELWTHAATRRGYARTPPGKRAAAVDAPAPPAQDESADAERPLIALPTPDPEAAARTDPPFAAVVARRRSIRRDGRETLSLELLATFLRRTFGPNGDGRAYPSGGACYPLKAYLVVHRPLDPAGALYAYDEQRHALRMVSQSRPALNALLEDAAAAAGMEDAPQILVVLAARFARTRRVYGDLGYSLILKETGAVMQTAMLTAAAMGLAACPLGSGDARLFAALTGRDPLVESSVGEFTLGTLRSW